MWWGIIGHVTVEAGNTVGTDGAPPHYDQKHIVSQKRISCEKTIYYVIYLKPKKEHRENNRKLPHAFLLSFICFHNILSPTSPPPKPHLWADLYLYTERRKTLRRGRGRAIVAVLSLTRDGEVGSNEDDSRKSRVSPKIFSLCHSTWYRHRDAAYCT